jgi:adenylate cyclase
MPFEIERKFLVKTDSWRESYVSSQRLVDGLVAISDGRKVRVRLYEDHATLAIKTTEAGIKRAEFEYQIPFEDGNELIQNYCGDLVLAKTRHYVPFRGFTWEVDAYEGILDGVVVAEVEIQDVDAAVPLPGWVGAEITVSGYI